MLMTSCNSFFSFYQNRFLPAYLRMKVTLQEGNPLPQPIVDGITDSFTHLSHSFDSDQKLEDQGRVSLALDALIETTYLCYEIVVISIGSELSAVCEDSRKAKFCINMNFNEFKKEYAQFKATGNEAKKFADMKSDASCKAAINAYEETIALGELLLNRIDWAKVEDFERESEDAAALSAAREETSLIKDNMIDQLTNQLTQHPKRSIAVAVVIFIASGFFNAFLKDLCDQIVFPYAWQQLEENGINLTSMVH